MVVLLNYSISHNSVHTHQITGSILPTEILWPLSLWRKNSPNFVIPNQNFTKPNFSLYTFPSKFLTYQTQMDRQCWTQILFNLLISIYISFLLVVFIWDIWLVHLTKLNRLCLTKLRWRAIQYTNTIHHNLVILQQPFFFALTLSFPI